MSKGNPDSSNHLLTRSATRRSLLEHPIRTQTDRSGRVIDIGSRPVFRSGISAPAVCHIVSQSDRFRSLLREHLHGGGGVAADV